MAAVHTAGVERYNEAREPELVNSQGTESLTQVETGRRGSSMRGEVARR